MLAIVEDMRVSVTSIRGIGGVMMGSKRRSVPYRTCILSSFVRLSRGPWIFRSCLPRMIMESNVCCPNAGESPHTTCFWQYKVIIWDQTINMSSLCQNTMLCIKSTNPGWKHMETYLQCLRRLLQSEMKSGCRSLLQCSADQFCVAAASVGPDSTKQNPKTMCDKQ